MVAFYVMRIKQGKKKWNEVPRTWRQNVIDTLVAQGYTLNDDGTITKEE